MKPVPSQEEATPSRSARARAERKDDRAAGRPGAAGRGRPARRARHAQCRATARRPTRPACRAPAAKPSSPPAKPSEPERRSLRICGLSLAHLQTLGGKAVEGQYRDAPASAGHRRLAAPFLGQHLELLAARLQFDPAATPRRWSRPASRPTRRRSPCAPARTGSRTERRPRARRQSALNRILRKPNGYQTISDFLLNATRWLYLDGNAFALAIRNDRFEIKELHLMLGQCRRIAVTARSSTRSPATRSSSDLPTPAACYVVPARDVLHIRLHTPRHPLVGESPLTAAGLDVATANAMSSSSSRSTTTRRGRASFSRPIRS